LSLQRRGQVLARVLVVPKQARKSTFFVSSSITYFNQQ
jgi:hypothetical protein